MKTVLIFFLLRQFFYIRHVYSTMPIYCLQTLNTSDCNETPTKVFSYYKPGSRCELEIWRGCPTGNKFDTEEECSETCIFKVVEFETKIKHQLNAKCILPADLNNCNDKVIHGFKYDKILLDCVEVDTNCPSNIFEEKLECIQSCVRDLTWDEKMKLVSAQQSKELDSILESFSNSTTGDEEGSQTQTTDSLMNTDVNVDANTAVVSTVAPRSGEVIPAEDVEGKKLQGEDTNTTQSYENDTNSTSANNETASIGDEVTGVTKENNANTRSKAENTTETSQNIITTMKIGTAKEIEIA